MERKLPYTTCLTTAIDSLEKQAKFVCYVHLKNPIEKMKMELTFLHMFFSGLDYLKESDYDWYLCFSINTLVAKLGQIGNEFAADCESGDGHGRWLDLEAVMYGWEEKLQRHLIRSQTKDVCNLLLGGTFKCTSYPGSQKKFNECVHDTNVFADHILQNLRALLDSDLIAPVMKSQISFIQQGLEEFSMFVDPHAKLFDLIPHTRVWLNHISCLTYLYWIDGNDESLASIMESMLHGLLKKNLPCPTSRVISSHLQPTMIPQILSLHLDFLLGDLILFGKGDSDILEEGFMFMLSFIMDPPDIDSKDKEMIWAQIYAAINKFLSLIYSIRLDEMKEEILKASISDFLMKVNRVKALVRDHLFVVVPYSSQFTSPDTNAMGFLNNLVENLRSMLKMEVNLIPCLRTHGESLCNELELFGPVLKNIRQLLKDDGDKAIKDLFEETMNMIYNADYFTKLCLIRISAWYVIIALPSVIEHIKFIKIQINKLSGVEQMHTEQRIGDHEQMEGTDALRPRGVEGNENDFVAFKVVEENITNDLQKGRMSLTIISIWGSGGQGKTTLAKRIYDNPNVQCVFRKSVWCYVSKNCSVKDLLIHMLGDGTKDGGANQLEMEDLIVDVWRSLKGKRYLIVLDDVWDIDVLRQLVSSLPDENNGSRIMLTSRNQDLASQVKLNLISHPLPLFSDEESWELMKKRVFNSNDCDKEFMEIGNKIASYCQGLPLAVALIAGVLGRTERTLDSWNKVAENLKTHLAEEGCGNVLELSYKYLPDHLKPCFLFFAAFRRGKTVKAKRLKLLWIGEGFANQYGGTKHSEEDLATEYLRELVSLGLVAVTEWSTIRGVIKSCNIHDILYDLCLEKAKENNFMHWAELNGDNEQNILSSSWLLKYNHHRLRIGESDPFIKSSLVVAKRELPTSSLHSFLCTSWASRELSLRFLESFKILTVLKLKLRVEEFPEVILSRTCLRYLFLHFEGSIEAITPKIANLWKLRTLIMKFPLGHVTLLPFVLWNMMSLIHVDVKVAGLDLVGVDLENSSKSNIQSLGWLILDVDHGTATDFFRKFPNLRRLKFTNVKVQSHILEFLSIAGSLLTQLESLYFYGGEFEESPPLEDWNCAELPNLTKLTLSGTNIPWSVLSDIGKKLPNLHVLKLDIESCKGSSWKMEHGDFPNLRHLRLTRLSIENFDVPCDGNPFPSLEFLGLYNCKELQEIPLVFGEDNTLKRIDVFGGSEELKASALKILEDQREFGNDNFHLRDMDQDEFDRRHEAYEIYMAKKEEMKRKMLL